MNSVHEQLLKQCTTQCIVKHYKKSILIENPLSRHNNSIAHTVLCRVQAQGVSLDAKSTVTIVVPYRDKFAAHAVFVSCRDIDELHRNIGSSYHD